MTLQAEQQAPVTLIVDKNIETPLAILRIYMDYATINNEVEEYTDKLIASRRLPFNLDKLHPLDLIVREASEKMGYANETQVYAAAVQHYQIMIKQAQQDAWIVAVMKRTPRMNFMPEPYPAPEPPDEDWDIHLSEPVKDLSNPVERRLKQLRDAFDSMEDNVGWFELQQTIQEFGVRMERKVRQMDEDGFRFRPVDRHLHAEVRTDGMESPRVDDPASVPSVPSSDGDSRQTDAPGTP